MNRTLEGEHSCTFQQDWQREIAEDKGFSAVYESKADGNRSDSLKTVGFVSWHSAGEVEKILDGTA